MCYDLNEYNPFKPIMSYGWTYWNYDDECEEISEPMDDYNWEEWLAND